MASDVSHLAVEGAFPTGASRDIRTPECRFSEQGRLDGIRNDGLRWELTAAVRVSRGGTPCSDRRRFAGEASNWEVLGSDESQMEILPMVRNMLWRHAGFPELDFETNYARLG